MSSFFYLSSLIFFNYKIGYRRMQKYLTWMEIAVEQELTMDAERPMSGVGTGWYGDQSPEKIWKRE